jgi:tetratricopeptide (TPR) repeat protein/transcriptional regulator with XRE-family HTH domain
MGAVQSLTFGLLLKQHRRHTALTQEALAARVGYSPSYISQLERGERLPGRATVQVLATALALGEAEQATLLATVRAQRRRTTQAPAPRETTAPPLIGRLGELVRLEQHLAGDGPPVLVLRGEPGIGKSRLLHEAAVRAPQHGLSVLRGGCQQRQGQEPYAPLLGALAARVRAQPRAQVRADLQGCAWLVRLLPELVETALVPVPTWSLPPDQERRLMFAAVARFLANVAGPAGTLLVLDDLQWASADALELLASLVRTANELPLRVLGAYRDTDVHPRHALSAALADLVRDGAVAPLALGPLAPADAAHLVASVLRGAGADRDADRAAQAQRVLLRVGGIPFYLISCAQALDAGLSDQESAEHEVPWNVAHSIRQRVASLPDPAQELLAAAAVLGTASTLPLLAIMTQRPEDELVTSLDTAISARLLLAGEEGRYVFAHDLIRDAVVSDLGVEHRKRWHRQAAEALERRTELGSVELLAYHFDHGGDGDKAILYVERAGDRAHELGAHAEAIAHYQDLLRRLERLGRPVDIARASEKLGIALYHLARYDAALSALEQAADGYHAQCDPASEARVVAQIAWAHSNRGTIQEGVTRVQRLLSAEATSTLAPASHAALLIAFARLLGAGWHYREALEATERAIAFARRAHNAALLVQAEFARGELLGAVRRTHEALQVMEQVVAATEASGNLATLGEALNTLAQGYEAQGMFAKSRPHMDRALEVAKQVGDPVQVMLLTCNRGQSAFYIGEWRQARQYHERAVAMAQRLEPSLVSAYPFGGLGLLSLADGHAEFGQVCLTTLEHSAEHSGDLGALRYARCARAEYEILDGHAERAREALTPLLRGSERELQDAGAIKLLVWLAWAHLELGDVTRAERLIEQGLAHVAAFSYGRLEPDALRIQALIAMRQGRGEEAQAALDTAIARCRGMSYPYSEAKALYTSGLLHNSDGDPAPARARLEAALGLLRRLGEQPYAARVEQVLGRT